MPSRVHAGENVTTSVMLATFDKLINFYRRKQNASQSLAVTDSSGKNVKIIL